ncbi:MAG TPA: hypothetical protein VGQ20_06235 [Acidimicrobiales bacterium]|jgi:2-oxoglutarate ferredoxin oxidoreductase subunit alpha|nr:hypothetical protein [Acidimicrobiales bacterium]
MTRRLMEGSEAIAESGVLAGCRFFTGYPMTPFTEVLEYFAAKLPAVGGHCINAESELEAVGMAWGAASTGARAATGSTGQGLSLMQESFSEMTMAGLPILLFNMARGQFDYFQATRGGGHGDYRMPVLCPLDVVEAVEHVQLGFHLADKWRTPVLFLGDYLLAHTYQAVDVQRIEFDEALPPKDWTVDGTLSGTGDSRIVTSLGFDKAGRPFIGPEKHWRAMTAKQKRIEASEVRVEVGYCDDADVVVVAYGTLAKFVRYVVREMRDEGRKIGYVRPITLWPFPYQALADVSEGKRLVAVMENNAGQMIDDVRLGVLGRAPVEFIGCISTDDAGFGVGGIYNPDFVRARIEAAYAGEELPV